MKPPLILQHVFIWFFATLLTANTVADVDAKFSGFGRIVTGVLDESNVKYVDYDDNPGFDQDSLLGAQGRIEFNDKLSVTGLGILHSNSKSDSGVEWLYIGFNPTDSLKIKLGKFQTAFYSISDSLDVGYSYPWVIAPKEIYSDAIFKTFQGIDARYSHVFNTFTASIETYYGEFDGEINTNQSSLDTEVEDLAGIIGEVRIDNLRLRAAYHRGDVTLQMPEMDQLAAGLTSAGFLQSAASLATDGVASYRQLSADYDSLSYFFKAEWAFIDIERDLFADSESFYLTYGRHFGDISVLVTYANRNDDLPPGINEVPTGVSAQLDQLAAGYDFLDSQRVEEDVSSWALGVRWDFRSKMALKAEYKQFKLDSQTSSSFTVENNANFDNKAGLFLLALDWIY